MSRPHRTLAVAVFGLLASSPAAAQSAAYPSGHWAGAIKIPQQELAIEVDIAKSAKGEPIATFSNPGQHVRGLPLASVVVEGASVRLLLKSNAGGTFAGVVSDDGRSIAGNFTATQGGQVFPFTVTRTGDAKIDARADLYAFGLMLYVVLKSSIPPEAAPLANVLLGTLAAMATQVANFWLGSSSGSNKKTDMLFASTPVKP